MTAKVTYLAIPPHARALVAPDLVPDLGKHVVYIRMKRPRNAQVASTGFLVTVSQARPRHGSARTG